MFKRTVSLILTFITLLSLLNIAISSVSATENIVDLNLEDVDVSNGKFPITEGYHTVVAEPTTATIKSINVTVVPTIAIQSSLSKSPTVATTDVPMVPTVVLPETNATVAPTTLKPLVPTETVANTETIVPTP